MKLFTSRTHSALIDPWEVPQTANHPQSKLRLLHEALQRNRRLKSIAASVGSITTANSPDTVVIHHQEDAATFDLTGTTALSFTDREGSVVIHSDGTGGQQFIVSAAGKTYRHPPEKQFAPVDPEVADVIASMHARFVAALQ